MGVAGAGGGEGASARRGLGDGGTPELCRALSGPLLAKLYCALNIVFNGRQDVFSLC